MIEDFETFLKLHEAQLRISRVPEHFYSALYDKLRRDLLDAGETFSLLQVDYEDEVKTPYDPPFKLQVIAEDGIKANDAKHIYLVDHFWTFEIDNAKKQLQENESLRNRLASLMGLETNENEVEFSETIFKEIWKYCDIYFYAQAEAIDQKQSFWYVNDEVGSAVTHNSEDPNFRMVPFYYIPRQITYSLLFPICDIEKGEFATRNRHEDKSIPLYQKACVLPWQYHDFTTESSEHYKATPAYFSQGHMQETLPDLNTSQITLPKKIVYKVFAQYSVLKQNLTNEQFEITEDENEADIYWYSYHFTDYRKLSETPEKFVNQFPFEHVLTVKDLLAITCRRMGPKAWLPVSYNLREELPAFVSYYQKQNKNGNKNIWIVKPYNLARGLDIHITDDINFIIRLASTGPKIAQRYITDPVLFYRNDIDAKVKFDIRYIVLLKSVNPLQVYVYKNFFLRFSNKSFELNNFDTYEQHFTVMNYKSEVPLKKMLCADFKNEWSRQNSSHSWENVEQDIYKMMKEVFECAIQEKPPMGIGDSPQSRTLFGFDIMLEWNENKEVQPILLEVNWIPDCQRACDYYPEFYNDIFKCLFLNDVNNDVLQSV